MLIDAFVRQPAVLSPIAAVRKAIHEVYSGMREEESELEQARQRLVLAVPELRARLLEQVGGAIEMLNDAIAERLRGYVGDLAVQSWSGVLLGLMLSAYFASLGDLAALIDELDQRLACFEAGLPDRPQRGTVV